MSNGQCADVLVAGGICVAAYALIAIEKVDRTLVAGRDARSSGFGTWAS